MDVGIWTQAEELSTLKDEPIYVIWRVVYMYFAGIRQEH